MSDKIPYEELEAQHEQLIQLCDYQDRIVSAAQVALETFRTMKPDGEPAIMITINDDPVLAETVRHSLWRLESIINGSDLPPPVYVQGTIH